MSINILRYKIGEKAAWATVQDGKLSPLNIKFDTLQDLLKGGGIDYAKAHKPSPASTLLNFADVEILCPITEPCTIVCQGKNYAAHQQETGTNSSDQPFNLLFNKASSALTSAWGEVSRPRGVELLDYELELGLVIGKKIERSLNLSAADLPNYIAGIVMANDVSARDLQVPEGQWYHGKSFRSFCPVGPYLCILEPREFDLLPELLLHLSVNGKQRQNGQASQMIYRPHQTLNHISDFMNLRPGDLVLTGTPAGVAMQIQRTLGVRLAQAFLSPKELASRFIENQKNNGRFLNDGDEITSTIATADGSLSLGVQKLRIVAAAD